jgi:hypothetical protein
MQQKRQCLETNVKVRRQVGATGRNAPDAADSMVMQLAEVQLHTCHTTQTQPAAVCRPHQCVQLARNLYNLNTSI